MRKKIDFFITPTFSCLGKKKDTSKVPSPKRHMPSPITPEAVLEFVFGYLQEKRIEMSSGWELWLSSNFVSDQESMEEESLILSKSFPHHPRMGFMFHVLTRVQSYENQYSCSIYSGKIVWKEMLLPLGIRRLKETMEDHECTVYSALWDMLFNSEWMPVKKDEKGLYEFGDLEWENLDKLLHEEFPGISENFVAPGFDV